MAPFSPRSLELAAMIRPDVGGEQASSREIWKRVVEDGASLPGTWAPSLTNALAAARKGDAGLCTYLAAWLYRNVGCDEVGRCALAQSDEESRNLIWLAGVEPMVVEVPPGLERLMVRFGGAATEVSSPAVENPYELVPTDKVIGSIIDEYGNINVVGRGCGCLANGHYRSAEHFSVGEVVELTRVFWPEKRLRRVALHPEELQRLREVLPFSSCTTPSSDAEIQRLLQHKGVAGSVPGGRFHVLAYPLAGDFTKLLVRPAKRCVVDSDVLNSIGETLVSQCAKSGLWSVVELFLSIGVAVPDLSEEFGDLCGRHLHVRRQWCRDLIAARGQPISSFLQLVVHATGDKPMRAVLDAGVISDDDSLVRTVVEASRWDLLRMLLEEHEHGSMSFSVSSLLSRLDLKVNAPSDIRHLLRSQIQHERYFGIRASNLKAYFERQLSGEATSSAELPRMAKGEGGASDVLVLQASSSETYVLGIALRFRVHGEEANVVFVEVSKLEFDAAREALGVNLGNDAASKMLPVDLNGKSVKVVDPCGGWWVVVACPPSYLRRRKRVEATGSMVDLQICVPAGSLPTPYIPRPTLEVAIVTSCCKHPIQGALVHVDGTRAGITGTDGTLCLAWPPGRHVVSAPGHCQGEVSVVVRGGCAEISQAKLEASSELFFYLQDMSHGEEQVREGIMVTSSCYAVPAPTKQYHGAIDFRGIRRTLCGSGGRCAAGVSVLGLEMSASDCSEALLTLALQPKLGDRVHLEANEDAKAWFEDLKSSGDCVMSRLFATPVRLGTLVRSLAEPMGAGSNVNLGCAVGRGGCPQCLPRALGIISGGLRSSTVGMPASIGVAGCGAVTAAMEHRRRARSRVDFGTPARIASGQNVRCRSATPPVAPTTRSEARALQAAERRPRRPTSATTSTSCSAGSRRRVFDPRTMEFLVVS